MEIRFPQFRRVIGEADVGRGDLGGRHLAGAVHATAKLLDPLPVDVEADDTGELAERDGDREPDVSEADDGYGPAVRHQ